MQIRFYSSTLSLVKSIAPIDLYQPALVCALLANYLHRTKFKIKKKASQLTISM